MTPITQEELKRRGWNITSTRTEVVEYWLGLQDRDDYWPGRLAVWQSAEGRQNATVIVKHNYSYLPHITTIEQLEALYRLLTGKEPPAAVED